MNHKRKIEALLNYYVVKSYKDIWKIKAVLISNTRIGDDIPLKQSQNSIIGDFSVETFGWVKGEIFNDVYVPDKLIFQTFCTVQL